jgi:hypothetical protein
MNETLFSTPPTPRRWKRWLGGTALVLLLSFGVFVWGMHQPWGEPLAGVRLEPLHLYSRADIKPGSFYDLLEQAAHESDRVPLDPKSTEQLGNYKKLPPNDLSAAAFTGAYGDLEAAISKHQAAFDLLEQASQHPVETSFVFSGDVEDTLSSKTRAPLHLVRTIQLMLVRADRALQQGNKALALRTVEIFSGLALRNYRGCGMLEMLTANLTCAHAASLTKSLVEKELSEAELKLLEDLFAQAETAHPHFAELLRHDWKGQQDFLLSPDSEAKQKLISQIDSMFGKTPPWMRTFASLIGSEPANRARNMQVYYSQLITLAETDQTKFDSNPINQLYCGFTPHWRIYCKPDPISSFELERSGISIFDRIFERTLIHRTKMRAMQAWLAVHRYDLSHQNWPATLAAAMPRVPLDPCDLQPLRYRLDVDGRWLVYGIGSDRIDDGGQVSIDDPDHAADWGIWSDDLAQQRALRAKSTAKTKSTKSTGALAPAE